LLLSSDKMAPAQIIPDVRASATIVPKQGVLEDYEGNYRFAPIEEAQVARAMIKRSVSVQTVLVDANDMGKNRYFNTLYDRTISDIVIVGAGSAGLSCAYHLAMTRPDVSIIAIS
jgi:thiamine thiazole synthase